jgi:cytochrome c553
LSDSAAVERGRYLFQSITCSLCHAVDGSGAVVDDSPMIVSVAGPNLTRGRGGIAAVRSDTDLVRAIRRGVRHDGTSLLIMPSEVFTHLSEEDLASLLGYIRQLPAADRDVPTTHFGPMGRALLAFGKLNVLVAPKTPRYAAPETSPPRGTVEFALSSRHAR